MKKFLCLLLVFSILLAGCGATIYQNRTIANPGSTEPFCSIQSDSTFTGNSRGKYTVTAQGYGVLCSGKAYSKKEQAITHPLEIQSSGYKITVALSNGSSRIESITLTAGSETLVECSAPWYGTSYLYVVVVNHNYFQPSTENPPSTTTESLPQLENIEAP